MKLKLPIVGLVAHINDEKNSYWIINRLHNDEYGQDAIWYMLHKGNDLVHKMVAGTHRMPFNKYYKYITANGGSLYYHKMK